METDDLLGGMADDEDWALDGADVDFAEGWL
jgi:hypothetical protein